MKYPFIKCLNPKFITNQATKEKMIVGCGKCVACQNMRASSLSLKCKLESKCHKHTMFITLTYDDTFVPFMVPVAVAGTHGTKFYFISTCNRLKEAGTCKTIASFTLAQLDQFQEKLGTPHGIPYLSHRDAQLFIKRLRKNLSKYSDEKIRFFLCGEYGPKHIRPHYHILVWCSRPETAENMGAAVSESWKFGLTRTEYVKNDCANYVAHYVNCTSSLPPLYEENGLRPFACHSCFLGEKFYRDQSEKAYELTATEFIRRSSRFNDSVSEFTLWRNIKNYFYPKCRGYSTLSPVERKFLYTCYGQFRGRKKTHRRPSRLAEEIIKDIEYGIHYRDIPNNDLYNLCIYYDNLFHIQFHFNCFLKAQQLFTEHQLYDDDKYLELCSEYLEMRERWKGVIYRDLALSKHFLEFVCKSDKEIEISTKIHMIEYFYLALDYAGLTDQYQMQEELLKDESIDFDDLEFFYNSCNLSNLPDSPIYKAFRTEQVIRYHKNGKHKKQNDANKILFNKIGLID